MSGVTHIEVPDIDHGRRLDRFLREYYPHLTQGRIEKLLRKGEIRVDGSRVKSSHRLQRDTTIRMPPVPDEFPEPNEAKPKAKAKPKTSEADARYLRNLIVYEDYDVIVIDKPPGIPVQGGTGQTRHIDGMLPSIARDGEVPRLVHRIDKDTSGLLVLARTAVAARALAGAFRSKAARKTYWAAVIGVPKPRQGTIKAALIKAPGSHGEKMTAIDPRSMDENPDAKRAVTDYAVVDTAATRASWLVLRPVTGRTHQLRVHTQLIDCPMIGDGKYGPSGEDAERRVGGAISRKLHLHARRIRLPHPDGSGMLDVRAELPDHMRHSWELFGWDPDMMDDDDLLDGVEEGR